MRVFVSLPMHDRYLSKIRTDIGRVVNKAKNTDLFPDAEFVTAYTTIKPDEGVKYDRVWYLGRAIQMLSTCDAIIFSRDYHIANGCAIERRVAELYSIPIYYEVDDFI